MQKFSVDSVVNEFLDIAERNDKFIKHVKLQKLVYFAHGWNLALGYGPLVDEPVRVGKYGPLFRSVWDKFIKFGDEPIICRARNIRFIDGKIKLVTPSFEMELEDKKERHPYDLVEKIWAVYGGFSDSQLCSIGHNPGSPWRRIYEHFNEKIPRYVTNIPNDMIKEYFVSVMNKKE